MIAGDKKQWFTRVLLDWFAANRRDLPWRRDYDPYQVWIAEIMLQQTRMERAVVWYREWMRAFPDIAAVAAAPEQAVLRVWEGLGYYRRARNIQATARLIMHNHGGRFPARYEDILALPGIGPYSAAAIASTAFGRAVACVDGNVERVLARVFDIGIPVRRGPGKTLLRALAEDLLARAPAGRAGDFNQGLMELGEAICRKKSLCPECPVREGCDASRLNNARLRPVPEERVRPEHCEVVAGVLRLGDRVLVQRRRLDDRVWAGLWEFPGGMIERGESPEQAVAREFMEELELGVRARESVCTICHSYTSYRLRLHCFLLEPLHPEREPAPILHEACAWKWATAEELRALPLPAPHRRLAEIVAPFAGAGDRDADRDGKRV